MNILLPKLLIQALTQRPQPKLARRKRTRGRIPPPRRRRARKQQRTPLPPRIQPVLLERENRVTRKGEGGADVGVEGFGDFGVGDLEEGLPDAVPRVPEGYA